ncbi:MAG: PP2C family protein-serine/threonine phosphatase, partial [Limisphaerales bacterium]
GEVGGDFFNVLQLSDTQAGVFICDVMGHGVRSALVTAMVRALVEELKSVATDPGLLLARINGDLRAILQQTGTPLFTTAFYLVADLETRHFSFANAGHPKPFLIHRSTGVVELMKNASGKSNPALGLFQESVYPTTQSVLSSGDLILFYTDGLYEVEGISDTQYSQEMLFSAVSSHKKLSCPQLLDGVLSEIKEFSVTHKFLDDVCLVGMEVAPD